MVRFVFLDEGGISKHEPWVVVAGVIVHGDRQVIPLEEYLAELIEWHIPEEHREGFIFHAKDLWSGIGPIFKDREKWPLHKRLNILDDLVRIPRRLQIPIVFYAFEKARIAFEGLEKEPSVHEVSVAMHGMAFTGCTLRTEQQMREIWPNEIAQLVAEDNDQARAIIKRSHEIIRNPLWLRQNNFEGFDVLPLKRIRGAVQFASKSESGPLQLADTYAFFIRGHLSGHKMAYPFYRKLRKWMMILPRPDQTQWSKGSATFAPIWPVSMT